MDLLVRTVTNRVHQNFFHLSLSHVWCSRKAQRISFVAFVDVFAFKALQSQMRPVWGLLVVIAPVTALVWVENCPMSWWTPNRVLWLSAGNIFRILQLTFMFHNPQDVLANSKCLIRPTTLKNKLLIFLWLSEHHGSVITWHKTTLNFWSFLEDRGLISSYVFLPSRKIQQNASKITQFKHL